MTMQKQLVVAQLSGPGLDKWVAVAMECELAGKNGFIEGHCHIYRHPKFLTFSAGSNVSPVPMKFTPTTDWKQAGPIIEREKIAVIPAHPGEGWYGQMKAGKPYFGSTPLEAAMRAYVASVKGETFTA